MFTSRAEYRLLLRQDNADTRLSQIGYDVGLLPQRNYRLFQTKREAIQAERLRLNATRVDGELLAQILRRPEMSYASLPGRDGSLPHEVVQQVEVEIKYAGYIERQEAEIQKLKSIEEKRIPSWLDYNQIPSLRTEARIKLGQLQPRTLGQASRISGVSPADISILAVWLRRGPNKDPLMCDTER